MLRQTLFVSALALASTAAHSQTATTNCSGYGYTVTCNTTTTPGVDWGAFQRQQAEQQRQNQENLNRSMQNLGTAIAVQRERGRQRKAQKAVIDAMATATLQPAPTDEQPVLLACRMNDGDGSTSVALYERHSRADTDGELGLKTYRATFSPTTVQWTTPAMDVTLSRLDGSLVGVGLLKEIAGMRVTATCQKITERAF